MPPKAALPLKAGWYGAQLSSQKKYGKLYTMRKLTLSLTQWCKNFEKRSMLTCDRAPSNNITSLGKIFSLQRLRARSLGYSKFSSPFFASYESIAVPQFFNCPHCLDSMIFASNNLTNFYYLIAYRLFYEF